MRALHKHPASKKLLWWLFSLSWASAKAETLPRCPWVPVSPWGPTAVISLSLDLSLHQPVLWDTSYSQKMIPESFVQGRNHIHRWDPVRTGALFYNIPVDILSEISSLIF